MNTKVAVKKLSQLGLISLALTACGEKKEDADKLVLNFGHFPNVTHVQALVAHNFSREGNGWYEERLSKALNRDIIINWYTYNAGPSAMEAVFARSIDLTYVGPSPAINAFAKSEGAEIRIISGSVEGGAALVIPRESALSSPEDFRGKSVATPQLGNTQDVSARAWFANAGLHVTQSGGDVTILPTANPEQLNLFRQNRIDAVWTVEPWVSRLEREADGKVLVEESDSIATVLASRTSFLESNPEVAELIVEAHKELTQWVKDNPEEARRRVVAELEALTHSKINPELIEQAWKRITVTSELSVPKLMEFVRDSHKSGFLKSEPDVKGLIALPPYLASSKEANEREDSPPHKE